MAAESTRGLADFGVRSLVTHAIMAATLTAGVAVGYFLEGDLALVAFVGLVSFTAGVWICQSIHSLGNPDYDGILDVVRGGGD